jgi:hypothetical protein
MCPSVVIEEDRHRERKRGRREPCPRGRPDPANRKGGDKLINAKELAALDFEPWPAELKGPSNAEWEKLLTSLRIALRVVKQKKPELVKVADANLGNGVTAKILEGLISTLERFEGLLGLIQAAEVRWMAASSAAKLEAAGKRKRIRRK